MTVDEFIEELIKLREQGKGHFLVKDGYQGEDFDIEEILIDDDGQYIML